MGLYRKIRVAVQISLKKDWRNSLWGCICSEGGERNEGSGGGGDEGSV